MMSREICLSYLSILNPKIFTTSPTRNLTIMLDPKVSMIHVGFHLPFKPTTACHMSYQKAKDSFQYPVQFPVTLKAPSLSSARVQLRQFQEELQNQEGNSSDGKHTSAGGYHLPTSGQRRRIT